LESLGTGKRGQAERELEAFVEAAERTPCTPTQGIIIATNSEAVLQAVLLRSREPETVVTSFEGTGSGSAACASPTVDNAADGPFRGRRIDESQARATVKILVAARIQKLGHRT